MPTSLTPPTMPASRRSTPRVTPRFTLGTRLVSALLVSAALAGACTGDDPVVPKPQPPLRTVTVADGSASALTPTSMPDAAYLAATTKIPLSTLSDGVVSLTFSHSDGLAQVPTGWRSWSSPPYSESATPQVLDVWLSNVIGSVTIRLSQPVAMIGFEIQPAGLGVHTYTASYYAGATLVGTATLSADGNAGARLLAVRSNGALIDRIVLAGDMEVGVAQLRYALPAPPNRAPTATVGDPYTGKEGSPVTLAWGASDPDRDALTYTWNFGDGATGSGAALPAGHTYADNGTYTVQLTATDPNGLSSAATTSVTVGNVAPTVTGFDLPGTVTLAGASATAAVTGVRFADPGAADGPFATSIQCGTGVAASVDGQCTYTAVGTYTVSVTVTDKDGGVSAPLTRRVQVVYPWTGFLAPVDNLPVLNTAKAGSAIPLRFALGGDRGLAVLAAGSPSSQGVPCPSSAASAPVAETVTAGSSSLSYDAPSGQYSYVWKTDKAWANSCRTLTLTLMDGTSHVASFQFSR